MLQHIFLVYYHYYRCKKNQHITKMYNIIIINIIILMHVSNVLILFTLKTSGLQVIKE